MKNFRILSLGVFLFYSIHFGIAFGAEGMDQTGIVKGTVTLDGSPTEDIVVSIERPAKEFLRSVVTKVESFNMIRKGEVLNIDIRVSRGP